METTVLKPNLYLAFDESYSRSREKIAVVMCASTDPQSVKPRNLEKRRDLDFSVLDSDFVYTIRKNIGPITSPRYQGILREMLAEGIRILEENGQKLNIYLDGEISFSKYLRRRADSTEAIVKGDSRIPLLNRADHIAFMINEIVFKENSKRTEKFKTAHPEWREILARKCIPPNH